MSLSPDPTVQTESLVVIRTFPDVLAADDAQLALLSAGIHALVFADQSGPPQSGAPAGDGVALAVHRRDVDLAETALTVRGVVA